MLYNAVPIWQQWVSKGQDSSMLQKEEQKMILRVIRAHEYPLLCNAILTDNVR